MNHFLQKYNVRMVKIDIVVLTTLLYLFRTTIPFLKFPFLLLFFGLILFTTLFSRSRIKTALKELFGDFYLSIILVIILIVSFFLSNKLYLASFKDIINSIILFSIIFFLKMYVTSEGDLHKFYQSLMRFVVFFALIISIRLLYSYLSINPYIESTPSDKFALNSSLESLSSDYNFALLPVFFGMFSVLFFLIEPLSFFYRGIYNLILLVYSLTILFSGSRRGLIALATVIVILLIVQLISLFRKNGILKKIGYSSRWFILSIFILTFFLIGFLFVLPLNMKRITLTNLGIPVRSYKQVISTRLYRYSQIFSNFLYTDFEHIVWPADPDPRNPDTGWDTRIGTNIFPLTGENVEIVPENSIGYKMDNTCDAATWSNNAYSYIDISSLFIDNSKKTNPSLFSASVYCFISKDFDGTWAVISDRDGAFGKVLKEYDLNKKGTWQKLQICFEAKSGIPPLYLYWSKYGVTNFSTLKGYVIFAFPQYRKVTQMDSISSYFDSSTKNRIRVIRTNDRSEYYKGQFSNNRLIQSATKQSLNAGDYDFKNEYIHKYQQNPGVNSPIISQTGVFSISTPIMNIILSGGIDSDPIQRWAAKLIAEDTTYYGYKKYLKIDTISNNFLGERLMRWQFAWQIFKKEYNLKQKMFGGGFNFLNWYGYYFLNDKTLSDYPHNPFFSILLYSGIIGFLLYIFLLYKVFYYYLKYLKKYYLFFIFFLITFFFTFFSGGSPFDPPIMGFFMLLPFFLHSVHKSEIQPVNEKNNL